MGNYREKLYRILAEKWTIPEKGPLDKIADYLTRHDKLLALIAEVLIDIDSKLEGLGQIRISVDTRPIHEAIREMAERIRETMEGVAQVITRPKPIEMINSNKVEVASTKDESYDIDRETDLVMIQNIGDNNVRYMFNGKTSDSSPQVSPGSAVMINIPKRYTRLFLRGVDGSTVVVVSEWRYVES